MSFFAVAAVSCEISVRNSSKRLQIDNWNHWKWRWKTSGWLSSEAGYRIIPPATLSLSSHKDGGTKSRWKLQCKLRPTRKKMVVGTYRAIKLVPVSTASTVVLAVLIVDSGSVYREMIVSRSQDENLSVFLFSTKRLNPGVEWRLEKSEL